MRYFFGFLLGIGAIIVAFILLLHIFSGGSSGKKVSPLIRYADTDTTVQFTELGPYVADQNYQGYRITVGASESVIQTLQGYNQTITNTQTFTNNEVGFADFLAALDVAGFQKGDSSPAKSDNRGFCASGDTYVFEILTDSGIKQRYWWSSCNEGSFQGNPQRVTDLFKKQIPGFTQFTSGVNL